MATRRTRPLLALAIALGIAAPGVGPARAADVVYRATLGDRVGALLKIHRTDGTAEGTVRYDASGTGGLVLSGRGGGRDGPFEWREALERAGGPAKQTGAFRGTLTGGGRRGAGTWRSADGRKTRPLALERVARIETTSAKGITARVEYPVFDAPGLARLNDDLAAGARARLRELAREVRDQRKELEGEANQDLVNGLSQEVFVAVESAGPGVVSLLRTQAAYTGGAHGNIGLSGASWVVRPDGAFRSFGLWDALAKSPTTSRALSALLLKDLARQGASSVADGTVADLKDRLADATIPVTVVPAGLAFHFAPYEVGSFAEGAFRVVVPNRELAPFIRRDGPLAVRATARRAPAT